MQIALESRNAAHPSASRGASPGRINWYRFAALAINLAAWVALISLAFWRLVPR